jgi:beta-lactamase superfamily II metal-dependent hydrolase
MAARKKRTTTTKSKQKPKKKAPPARRRNTAPATHAAAGRTLIPPTDGAVVRMYRIGHGDCFLIAFDRKGAAAGAVPFYVLIDCGYKPGSPAFISTTPADVVADIEKETGGHIDIAIITHEHQDHVNAITANRFRNFTIGESWFAWTEDPDDDVAKQLRKDFNDKLLGLLAARNRLAADGDTKRVARLDNFLSFELGSDDGKPFNPKAALAMLGAAGSSNKNSMKVFKDKATKLEFLVPHRKIYKLKDTNVRVFALGPPRNAELLASMDPIGSEEFHMARGTNGDATFFAAAAADKQSVPGSRSPFTSRFWLDWDGALKKEPFFKEYYGKSGKKPADPPLGDTEVESNADWRRIDRDWLFSSEQLALDMNNQTNNSSLVLAFELGKGGKVLLFAADAQRGNWISWAKKSFKDGTERVTARDLLQRTVLYKVGHHGSHNATLNGLVTDEYPCLAWMGEGEFAREFTAMITAVRKWAVEKAGWDHPLKAIRDALVAKASGRVFQTDTDFATMSKPPNASQADWNAFKARTKSDTLYFDYQIKV